MKFVRLSAVVCLVMMAFGACTPQAPTATPPLDTVCTGQRQQMCTQISQPVCAKDVRGTSRTYGNSCAACADKQVISHRPGAC